MQITFTKELYSISNIDDKSLFEIVTPNQFKHFFNIADICGLRLNIQTQAIDEEFDYRRLMVLREYFKFDLIQILTEVGGRVGGFFLVNQVFELKASPQPATFETAPITPPNDRTCIAKELAFAELMTRFIWPGSTVVKKDVFLQVMSEHQDYDLHQKKDATGDAFILSVNRHEKGQMICFFWSNSKVAGFGHDFFREYIRANDKQNINYFVSIFNVAAIKTLLKLGFNQKYDVWNYTL